MYYNGQGVAESKQTAARWFRRAADQGPELAQQNLDAVLAQIQGEKKEETAQVRGAGRTAKGAYVDISFVTLV